MICRRNWYQRLRFFFVYLCITQKIRLRTLKNKLRKDKDLWTFLSYDGVKILTHMTGKPNTLRVVKNRTEVSK